MSLFLQATEVITTTTGEGGILESITPMLPMILLVVVFYFFMIRPQQKRQKELNKFRDSLVTGMKVVTAGGIYGTIKEVKDAIIVMEIDKNVSISIDKNMVMQDTTKA